MLAGAVMITLFTQCKKCEEHQVGFVKPSPDCLSINPYSGNEFLIYKNSAGDSVLFNKGIRGNSTENKYQYYSTAEYHECRGDYYIIESNNTTFKSINKLWEFSINLTFGYYYHFPPTDTIIQFQMYTDRNNHVKGLSHRDLVFGKDTIYNSTTLFDTGYVFHKTLTLGQTTYNNIYEILLTSDSGAEFDIALKEYYSITYGLVGFSTFYGENWFLVKKGDNIFSLPNETSNRHTGQGG